MMGRKWRRIGSGNQLAVGGWYGGAVRKGCIEVWVGFINSCTTVCRGLVLVLRTERWFGVIGIITIVTIECHCLCCWCCFVVVVCWVHRFGVGVFGGYCKLVNIGAHNMVR